MVEEIHQCSSPGDVVDVPIGMGLDFDTVIAEVLNVEVGTGAADNGSTLPVVGMKCWKHWLQLPWIRAHEAEIKYDRCNKLFRFGASLIGLCLFSGESLQHDSTAYGIFDRQ